METATKRVKRSKNNQAHIGVVRYDFGISDLHPQAAEGDGRTLISIGGWTEVQVREIAAARNEAT
jgi:GH18 family chitinase